MRKTGKSSPAAKRVRRRLFALLGLLILLGGLAWGVVRLHALWIAPCTLTDVAEQISLEGNEYVPSDTILSACGLANGVNLAEYARRFEQVRARVLARIPNLRTLDFTRYFPNQLDIRVSERTPLARLGQRGGTKRTGRVVDEEGVVFLRTSGTQLLPAILEPTPTPKGKILDERARAALDLVVACRDPELEKLNLQAVDATPKDYLLITFGTHRYNRAKIDWEGCGQPTEKARKALRTALLQLKQAVDTHLGERVLMWNATIPNRVFADTQEPIR